MVEADRRIGQASGVDLRVVETLPLDGDHPAPGRTLESRPARERIEPAADVIRRAFLAEGIPSGLERSAKNGGRKLAVAHSANDQVEDAVEIGLVQRDENFAISGPGSSRKLFRTGEGGCRSLHLPTFRRGSECRSVFRFVKRPMPVRVMPPAGFE